MKKLFNHTKRPDRNWEEDVQDGYDWDAYDARVPVRSRHNTLFAQTKPASRSAYTAAAQPERAFHSICCVYISQPDQLYHHIPDSEVEIPD